MLDSFKKPPAKFRNTKPGQENKKPVLMRELKREFDRLAISDADLSEISSIMTDDCPHSKLIVDYISRVSYTLSLGKRKAQAALLKSYRSNDFFDFFDSELPHAHVSYDVVDEAAICKATAIDQRLITSENEYELLILPPMESIAYTTAIKIQEFVEDGGRMIATRPLPTRDSGGNKHEEIASIFSEIGKNAPENGVLLVDNELMESAAKLRESVRPSDNQNNARREPRPPTRPSRDDENPVEPKKSCKSRKTEYSHLRELVCLAIKPDVSIRSGNKECRDIICTHRIWQGAEIFFFANSSNELHEVQLSIRCDKAPHILDPETGKRIALVNCTQIGSRTILLHRFESCGSLMLCFDDQPSLAIPTPYCEFGDEMELPGNWNVVDNENETCFSQTVMIPEFLNIQRVVMSLEEPLDIVEFIVNGAMAGTRLWPPYEMDITALVKPGPNEITLKFNHGSHFCGKGKITIY
jgi:hypothetical protein